MAAMVLSLCLAHSHEWVRQRSTAHHRACIGIIGDMWERSPMHACYANIKELIRRFMEELERHKKKNALR